MIYTATYFDEYDLTVIYEDEATVDDLREIAEALIKRFPSIKSFEITYGIDEYDYDNGIKADPSKEYEAAGSEMTAEEVKELYAGTDDEKKLAFMLAVGENNAYSFGLDMDEDAPDTPEYKELAGVVDAWFEVADDAKRRIFSILQNKGIGEIPKNGHREFLRHFMKNNGFIDLDGWWCEENKKEDATEMAENVNYYQDKEETDSLFKMDWNTNTGYIWNYLKEAWVEYEPVMDYIMDGENLRVISEKDFEKMISKTSIKDAELIDLPKIDTIDMPDNDW